ncbi:lamin tail domain-containing protein [Pyxidicoccus xibeiensis]|uniref:lamin tail domain-containing protein n=1 Tax=Pyxidicoccus xibeiensis TaxID=2906759 RepID=UPI0020A805CF|nr:lamin tail domain-containing protein [Pyxidicoccus xibeiensis]MCP3139527.1 lamin tail domain-containing protein [Pyxidicoccus xibeiensis]
MTSARLAGTLAVLVLLSACSNGRDEPGGGPRLPSSELPSTTVGATGYEVLLKATGGTTPLTYATVGTPPPGFSFAPVDAKLTGPASEAGDHFLTVYVRDAEGREDTRTWSLKVWPAPVVSSAAPPTATSGSSYLHTFVATGGQPPLRWSVAEGSLPMGLSLGEDGVLSGLPQGRGPYPFTLRVQDANGVQGEARLSLEVSASGGLPDGGPPDGGPSDSGPPPPTFPLAVANWNIEFFGQADAGPSNEALQLTNVQAVIADAGADVWGLAEIVSTAQFNELKTRLPGYDGFLADDSMRVSSGSSYYDENEQKLGVLFKSGVVQVLRAEVVLTQYNFEFAGRPPLRVDLRVTRGGSSMEMTVMVVHLKAMATTSDYNRRQASAVALKNYLDTNLPTQRVMVVGDWNDDVDTSTTGQDTPFRNFVDDTARYTFTTQALTYRSSTSSGGGFIDHQLATNEMIASYVPSSAVVIQPSITGYRNNTSDHYPILSRFDLGQGKVLRLTAPNGGEALRTGTTYDITWQSNGLDTVRLRYSLDNGQTWLDIASSVPAAPGRYTWTVPADASSGARVQVSDTQDAAFGDASDGTFLLNRTAPRVFINEYLPQPHFKPGTTTVDFDQMFVELLNTGSTAVDISGWRIHDDESYSGAKPARHTFPSGSVLQPGQVYIVYSGAPAVPPGATNATYANGNDGLRFNRGVNVGSTGDSVYLVLPDGTVEDSHSYVNTTQGTSYNRSPDASATGTWVLHSTLSSSLTASPGQRANGSAF